jgi:hypothetical protein
VEDEMDVHFYMSEPLGFKEWLGGLNGYHESWYALYDENRKELHTTQLALLGEPLLANGHRVFIQIPLQDEFEIKLGKNDHTQIGRASCRERVSSPV